MTCAPCLDGRHFRCRGCGCSVCGRPKARAAVVKPAPKRPSGPRTWHTVGNRAEVVDPQQVLGLVQMLHNYQLTGVLE